MKDLKNITCSLMNDVIIIGGNHHNSLGAIRALGEKGLRPTFIVVTTEKKPFVGFSKYLSRTIQIPNNELIPETLLSECKVSGEKPVIICCSDPSSGVIDENRNRLSSYFLLPGASAQGRIAYLMSKKVMSNLAVEVGLQIPQTYYCDEFNVNNIPLPCILKPLVSRKGKKSDIHICRTKDEIKDGIDSIGPENLQIQQFIDKKLEYQLIGCSTGSEVIIPGVSHILRPCKGSNTSFLQYVPLNEDFCDLEKCKEFVIRTGYRGLFSLEFLRDKQGNDFFMEINFRNDGNAICVTEAGVNLPYIWYLACKGQNYQEEMTRKIKPSYIMPDTAELKLLLTGQISLIDYINDFRKTDRFMEYDKNDPRPFWRMVRAKLHLW